MSDEVNEHAKAEETEVHDCRSFSGPTGQEAHGDKRRRAESARLRQRFSWTPANSHWFREQMGRRFSASFGWMPSKTHTANQVMHNHTWRRKYRAN